MKVLAILVVASCGSLAVASVGYDNGALLSGYAEGNNPYGYADAPHNVVSYGSSYSSGAAPLSAGYANAPAQVVSYGAPSHGSASLGGASYGASLGGASLGGASYGADSYGADSYGADSYGAGGYGVAAPVKSHGLGYGAGVPVVAKPKSYGVVIGGKRGAGAAYRYRNGNDVATVNGAREYDHNAGYGWAVENDAAAPHNSLWSRNYDSAQSSSWGHNRPQSYKVPTEKAYKW